MSVDAPLSEFSLIEHYFGRQRLQRQEVVEGIGDDAALLTLPPGHQQAVAIDTLVAGRHFPPDTSPADIGYKALAVNLSDLAAMGAEPSWFTLSLSLPEADDAFLSPFSEALFGLAGQHRLQLVGGDTVRGPLVVTVQVTGQLPAGEGLLRSGARPGDRIYVTGAIGDAGAGLAIAQQRLEVTGGDSDYLLQRLNRPTPRVAVGMALRGIATAAIDISDGLLADIGHLLGRSSVGAQIDVGKLPLSSQLVAAVGGREAAYPYALSAGDDYELCFTVPAAMTGELEAVAAQSGCPLTAIGECRSGEGVTLLLAGLPYRQERAAGFDHFNG